MNYAIPSFSHDFAFDPTYGYDFEQLLSLEAPPAPEGFDEFWQDMYARALQVEVKPQISNERVIRKRRIYDLSYTSLDGVTIRGWLSLPKYDEVKRGIVISHGYGGRSEVEFTVESDTAAIFPCSRGLSLSALPGLDTASGNHVLQGIEKKETYIHGGCAADIWTAVSALHELVPETRGSTSYQGGSFGGGIGALALPWDDRLRAGFLVVPSFGNHPFRLGVPCTGSGESVRKYVQEHPRVATEVLSYFDSAIAATRIKQPVLCSCALFDPAVPPPGQFCVYNSLGGPKELFVRQAGHFSWPGEFAEQVEALRASQAFFAKYGG